MDSLKRIDARWFGLVDCALEISLTNGNTEMFAFPTNLEREKVLNQLQKSLSPFDIPRESLADLTAKWQKGDISNFSYLMSLNSAAGRTFNDLMQYPGTFLRTFFLGNTIGLIFLLFSVFYSFSF